MEVRRRSAGFAAFPPALLPSSGILSYSLTHKLRLSSLPPPFTQSLDPNLCFALTMTYFCQLWDWVYICSPCVDLLRACTHCLLVLSLLSAPRAVGFEVFCSSLSSQVLLTPIHALYAVIGPTAAEWLAQGPLGLAEAGAATPGAAGCLSLCTCMAAPAGLAIWALARASNSITKSVYAAML